VKIIEAGQRLRLGADARAVDVRCIHVIQRNWSRVAVSEEVNPPNGHSEHAHSTQGTWFLKQSVDRRRQPQVKLWRYEREGFEAGQRTLGDIVQVPRIGFSTEDELLHAFEFLPCVPPDELLRRSEGDFDDRAQDLLDASARILGALERHAPDSVGLESRERSYGGSRRSVCFKGLDIRNLAWRYASDGGLRSPSEFVMFDFGRPYLTAVEEAGAKLLVSVGLLNWGRPLRRFAQGPDLPLLDRAAKAFAGYLSPEAILAEIDLQERGRLGDPKARSFVGRTIKRFGIGSLGIRYLDKMRSWCRQAW